MNDSPLHARLVRSRYAHRLPLDTGSVLCIHALVQTRLILRPEVAAILDEFTDPREVSGWIDGFCASRGLERTAVLHAIDRLVETRLLTPGSPEDEERDTLALASQLFGRDPDTARAAARRWSSQQVPRFAAPIPRTLASFAPRTHRLDVVMVGLCDVQIELDILRELGAEAGIDLRPVPTLETTLDLLGDTPHDAVIVGALGARHGHWYPGDGGQDCSPGRYLQSARDLLDRIRTLTEAPVLLHNLPVPTCSPLGYADRGPNALARRCRRINDGLAALAAEVRNTYVVDVDAALGYEGKRTLLDDRLMTFTHLGGLGWWTMLPPVELATVFGEKPPVERLAELGVDDPFGYDRVVAAEQVALLSALFGINRRAGVGVWLDGTLWPGRLVDHGSPFPRGVDFGIWSYHSFYVGVHEALKALRERGVRLVAIGSGDEPEVRRLWRFPDLAPMDRLMSADDFDLLLLGESSPAEQLRRAAECWRLASSDLVYVDADPARRAEVGRALPDLMVLGDNPFRVRGDLLTVPALQRIEIAGDPVEHPSMLVALATREKARRASGDVQAFTASLGVQCRVRRGVDEPDLDRVYELVARTNQFTTTAHRYTRRELATFGRDVAHGLYTLNVVDRFADYGLAGVVVSIHDSIELFVLSCRVVGLGVDQVLLRVVTEDLLTTYPSVRGRVIEQPRNFAARDLFARGGFDAMPDGTWLATRALALSWASLPTHYAVTCEGLAALPRGPGAGGQAIPDRATERDG